MQNSNVMDDEDINSFVFMSEINTVQCINVFLVFLWTHDTFLIHQLELD
jgi:hypothetical protein